MLIKKIHPCFTTFSLIFCLLLVIVFAISNFNSEVLFCMDEFTEEMLRLKRDLEYWQSDLQGLQDIYNSNYSPNNIRPLTQVQLQDKIELENSMKEGKNNVRTCIAELKKLQFKQNNYSEYSPTLGKRNFSENEDTLINIDNKREK